MEIRGFEDTIAWYNQNAETYAEINATVADVDQIDELTGLLPAGASILDVGCAAGRDSNLFCQRGFKVTGVDLSEGLLSIAEQHFPGINFIKADLRALPFENESFAAVWAHQSLLHLETPKEAQDAIQEFHRVLTNNGILHILVKAQTGKNKTAVVSDAFSGHDRFFQYFTTDEIGRFLARAGFETIKLEEYRESDKKANGRPEVGLIYSLSRK